MAKVACEVAEIEVENERGRMQSSVRVTCTKCDRSETSFGTSEKSIKRCLVLLKEGCDESNYYTCDGS